MIIFLGAQGLAGAAPAKACGCQKQPFAAILTINLSFSPFVAIKNLGHLG
jgi:hypothetical protein